MNYRSREETLEEELRIARSELAKANEDLLAVRSEQGREEKEYWIWSAILVCLCCGGAFVMSISSAIHLNEGRYIQGLSSAFIAGYFFQKSWLAYKSIGESRT